MSVICPFCKAQFNSPEDWCPHFLGMQADLTLDDYKDFISGEFPAETVTDEEENPYYFMVRNPDEADDTESPEPRPSN